MSAGVTVVPRAQEQLQQQRRLEHQDSMYTHTQSIASSLLVLPAADGNTNWEEVTQCVDRPPSRKIDKMLDSYKPIYKKSVWMLGQHLSETHSEQLLSPVNSIM